MLQRIKLLEKFPITQRQALLTILALDFMGTMVLVTMKFMALVNNVPILFSTGLIGAILFGGGWFLYYRYAWEPVRFFAATASTLLVALSLPEPFISTYAPMAIIIPVVLSLIVGGTLAMILNSVLMIAILLVRAGGSGVYAHPATLTIYAMIVGGLLVKRLIDAASLRQLEQAQMTVKQSEQQMRALVSSLDDIIFQFDEQGTYLNVWGADEELLFQPKDRLLGRRISEVLGKEQGLPFEEAILRVVNSGQVENMEYCLDVIGGKRWFNARITSLLDVPRTVCMLVQDVSDKKRAEEVLQASEQRYRLLFEENPLPLLVYDSDSLRILAANDAASAQYRYGRDEFLQMTIREIMATEELPRLEALLHRPRLRQERSSPWKQRKKDGTFFDAEVVSNETSYLGRPARLVLLNDVTEQLQARAALAASEMRFRSLIENSADGITVVDAQGMVTYVSPSIERLLGYTPAEAIGLRAMDFVHREDRVRLLEHVARLNRAGTGHEVLQYRFRHKDGSWHWLESTLAHQADVGAVQGIVFNYRDVTERKQVEQEIESLADFPRENNSPVLRFSHNGMLLYANPASGGLLEQWSCEVGGQPPEEIQRIIDEALADSTSREVEIAYGNTIDALMFVPIPDKAYINVYSRDITERKKAESDLQASESRYRLATRATNDLIWEWHAATDQLIWAENERTIFGFSSEEIAREPDWWENHIHPEDRQRVVSGLENLVNSRESFWVDEYRFQYKDGSYATVSDHGYVERDAAGRTIRVIGAVSDITQRRQDEAYIHYQARLLENVSDAVVATDMAARVTSWNPAAEKIYGWPAGEVLGRPIDEILQTEYQDQTTTEQSHQQLLEQGLWRGEVIQKRRDGTRVLIQSAVSIVRDHFNAPVGMVANNCDISERRQAEEQLRILNLELENRVAERTMELHCTNAQLEHASRAKDEFLANMSHELRTPLNSILGLSETLLEQRRGPLNEHQQRSLRIIEQSGAHLLDLINDILDLSKIEAGKFDFYPETVHVDDLMHSSMAFVKSQAMKKSIKLSYEADPLVSTIQADPRRLKQILVNLLTNAVKFTPAEGRVVLQVSASAEKNLVRFSVIDTGIGIAAKDLARLFRPFEQVDSQLNRQYEGTGLGLALVQKLTDLHGGSVQVESEVGKGSCFTINLPWERELPSGGNSGPKMREPAREPSGAEKKSARPIRILLAEDHVANILTIGEYLESRGYQVIVAHDGGEALEKAQETDPDLILMDIQMPVIDGLQVTSRLRTQARFTRTPIIALTALAMPGDRERCLLAGANEYMSKPVSLQRLVHTIQKFTKG